MENWIQSLPSKSLLSGADAGAIHQQQAVTVGDLVGEFTLLPGHRGGARLWVKVKEKRPGELNTFMCRRLTTVPGTQGGGQQMLVINF